MWPILERGAFAVALLVGLGTTAHAADFDHLILGKVKAGARPNVAVDLDAMNPIYDALDGSGCEIKGAPRMMLFPVTVTPAGSIDVPSPTLTGTHPHQAWVCYKLRCAVTNPLVPKGESISFRDKLVPGYQVVFPASSRMLCVPAIPDTCEGSVSPSCGGTCGEEDAVCADLGFGCQCIVQCADKPWAARVTPPCVPERPTASLLRAVGARASSRTGRDIRRPPGGRRGDGGRVHVPRRIS